MIPFRQRVALFQQLVTADRLALDPHGFSQAGAIMGGRLQTRVHRNNIVQDAFNDLNEAGKRLKSRVQVSFVSEQGVEEAGIDGGGLFKEFMDCITKAAFDPEFGLFTTTTAHLLVPNPASHLSVVGEEHLSYFGFLGRLLGKALYERILVESQFAGVFLNALLGRQNSIDDLFYLDEQVTTSF